MLYNRLAPDKQKSVGIYSMWAYRARVIVCTYSSVDCSVLGVRAVHYELACVSCYRVVYANNVLTVVVL
jgi:hypothetical protein